MTHTVTIRRHDVWRVVDMPGLARIDFEGHRRAVLHFPTAPGCEPVDEAFVLSEVARMKAIPLSWAPLASDEVGSTEVGSPGSSCNSGAEELGPGQEQEADR